MCGGLESLYSKLSYNRDGLLSGVVCPITDKPLSSEHRNPVSKFWAAHAAVQKWSRREAQLLALRVKGRDFGYFEVFKDLGIYGVSGFWGLGGVSVVLGFKV